MLQRLHDGAPADRLTLGWLMGRLRKRSFGINRRAAEHHRGVQSIPFTSIVPALVIALISLAYLEEDGLLLLIGLSAAVVVLTIALAAVWETVVGAEWITTLL